MSAIIPFQFEAHAVRVQVDDAGLPWFNATDVCDALEMGNRLRPSSPMSMPMISRNWRSSTTSDARSVPITSTNRASTP